jgi:glutaredoxin
VSGKIELLLLLLGAGEPLEMPNVTLYTRRGCHLCEDAATLLRRYGLEPQEIDIDQDPELVTRYGESIPVVVLDGVERFRGRISETLLRRLMTGLGLRYN